MKILPLWILSAIAGVACFHGSGSGKSKINSVSVSDTTLAKLLEAAYNQTQKRVTYDGRYFQIPYPMGDIPDSLGVCTDVLIRAYRKVGYDLQKLVHEDITRSFAVYQQRRFSAKPDANIDHRRCPNLETFFSRYGRRLPVTDSAIHYQPGDIVFWKVSAGHVGIVSACKSPKDSTRFMVVHNIGAGPQLEDFLFRAEITGHYRYTPWKKR